MLTRRTGTALLAPSAHPVRSVPLIQTNPGGNDVRTTPPSITSGHRTWRLGQVSGRICGAPARPGNGYLESGLMGREASGSTVPWPDRPGRPAWRIERRLRRQACSHVRNPAARTDATARSPDPGHTSIGGWSAPWCRADCVWRPSELVPAILQNSVQHGDGDPQPMRRRHPPSVVQTVDRVGHRIKRVDHLEGLRGGLDGGKFRRPTPDGTSGRPVSRHPRPRQTRR